MLKVNITYRRVRIYVILRLTDKNVALKTYVPVILIHFLFVQGSALNKGMVSLNYCIDLQLVADHNPGVSKQFLQFFILYCVLKSKV